MKPLITKQTALDAIGKDRLDLLASCTDAGWADWVSIRSLPAGAELSASARATIIHEGAVRRAKAVFPSVMCGRKDGLFVLDFSLVLVRFKLLHHDLSPRGIPTGQAVMFERQGQLEEPSLWGDLPMLIMGYVPDKLATKIDRHVLVLRRNYVIWEHEVRFGGDTTLGVPSVLMPSGDGPQPPAVRSTRPQVEVEKEAR